MKSLENVLFEGFSTRVSAQGVKSLGGYFSCLCRGVELYELKKVLLFFKKKMEILQKEQNSTNLQL